MTAADGGADKQRRARTPWPSTADLSILDTPVADGCPHASAFCAHSSGDGHATQDRTAGKKAWTTSHGGKPGRFA